jgi:hypothetical protein
MRSEQRGPSRGSAEHRRPYRPGYGDHGRHRDRDHDGWRRGWYAGSYGYAYPGYLYSYPYVINSGFYDWGDSGDSGYGADSSASQGYAEAVPNPGYDAGTEPMQGQTFSQTPVADARMPRPAYAGMSTASPEPEQPITVIFKDGRAPKTMQNYMMNSRTLTDLDQQHYEQIPLDQIDIAATEHTNRARGLEFQVPSASRE